jgi:hypothetical protein
MLLYNIIGYIIPKVMPLIMEGLNIFKMSILPIDNMIKKCSF